MLYGTQSDYEVFAQRTNQAMQDAMQKYQGTPINPPISMPQVSQQDVNSVLQSMGLLGTNVTNTQPVNLNYPATATLGATGPTIRPITDFNAPNVDVFPASMGQPGIGSTQPLGSTRMQPQAMGSTQFSQPFSASNIYQQLQGANTPQTFQPFNYSNVYQQPNLYNQFYNPFAMQPFFNQLGLTNIAGTKF
jgi:hypothetical protein